MFENELKVYNVKLKRRIIIWWFSYDGMDDCSCAFYLGVYDIDHYCSILYVLFPYFPYLFYVSVIMTCTVTFVFILLFDLFFRVTCSLGTVGRVCCWAQRQPL